MPIREIMLNLRTSTDQLKAMTSPHLNHTPDALMDTSNGAGQGILSVHPQHPPALGGHGAADPSPAR